jgi:hypothetical protein
MAFLPGEIGSALPALPGAAQSVAYRSLVIVNMSTKNHGFHSSKIYL